MIDIDSYLAVIEARHQAAGRQIYAALDGRSGAGKTSTATRMAGALRARGLTVTVLEVETFVAGWDGLEAGTHRVAHTILAPLSHGESPLVASWNWVENHWNEPAPIPLTDVLVLAGCGATSFACAPYMDVTAWLEAPESVRRARVAKRDGDPSAWWERWARQETQLLAERDSPALADFLWTTA
ncbi:hypothetical protein [Neoactinobaculum massilliense]|uniref:hypothetical protein n=1 Tax=Neoactinobaculum massilliense TaxID=2364794 RepID=UPI000F52B3D2|nr:hypothetical protein [Neoactinobaculum massilliense]